VRSADDCNVYVRSKRAADRVMAGLIQLYAKRKLRINPAKSAVARAWERSFLGYSFWVAPGKIVKRRVAPKALEKMKERVREITSRNGGRSLTQVVALLRSYLVGWKSYFRLAERFRRRGPMASPPIAHGHPQTAEAGHDTVSDAARAGPPQTLGSGSGGALRTLVGDGDAWRSEIRLSDAVLRLTGSPASWPLITPTHRTAGCGPACPVVWEGSRRGILSYSLSRFESVILSAANERLSPSLRSA